MMPNKFCFIIFLHFGLFCCCAASAFRSWSFFSSCWSRCCCGRLCCCLCRRICSAGCYKPIHRKHLTGDDSTQLKPPHDGSSSVSLGYDMDSFINRSFLSGLPCHRICVQNLSVRMDPYNSIKFYRLQLGN